MPNSLRSLWSLIDGSHTIEYGIIVSIWDVREIDPSLLQFGHRLDDVVRGQSDVLDTCPFVELDVLLDLRFLAPSAGSLMGNLMCSVGCRWSSPCSSGPFTCGNVLVIEGDQLSEAHHLRIEFCPNVHLVPANIPDHVIDVCVDRFRGGILESSGHTGRNTPW